MQILKLLNKQYLSIILIFIIFPLSVYSVEPVDIWSIEGQQSIENNSKSENLDKKNIPQNSIYKMQSQKSDQIDIEQDQTLISKGTEIIGLYDPAENGLNINMWSNSDGETLFKLLENINKIDLSEDASEILNILFLTNAYYPNKNITEKQFTEIKSNWLIKYSNFELIEKYLLQNQIVNRNSKLTKYLVDEYLSRAELEKSCEVFLKNTKPITDDYLSKFNIYCLVDNNRKEEAQLLLDLKKEMGFKDKFFEKKISYLMGYEETIDKEISEDTILSFHLSHRTDSEFSYETKDTTSKLIWKYLSTSNLLDSVQDIELSDLGKIAKIEKATHEGNYTEKELFDLYKRFQFNITQLLSIKESSKLLTTVEARALIYQGVLITSETQKKLELLNALKNSFIAENIENAFDKQLKFFLEQIDFNEVTSDYSSFYKRYVNEEEVILTNIKINNKILHQSKLLNYFKRESSIKNIEKELNDSLKKVKKDKKYFFSLKDIMLVESLKSDGIRITEKYKNLYEIDDANMPADIQTFIDNGDIAAALLRVVEVIGADKLKDIDPETMVFIISTLNQLDIDILRNQILLKILPLKV